MFTGLAVTVGGIVLILVAAGLYLARFLMCLAVPLGAVGAATILAGAALFLDGFKPTRLVLTFLAKAEHKAGLLLLGFTLLVLSPLIVLFLVFTPPGWLLLAAALVYYIKCCRGSRDGRRP